MPCLIAPTPDGKRFVLGTTGWHNHTLNVFEFGERPIASPNGQDSQLRSEPIASVTAPNYWRGISFGKGNQANVLFVAGGASRVVWRYRYEPVHGQLQYMSPLSLPSNTGAPVFPGGLAITPDGSLLVIDENANRGINHVDLLYKLDPESGAEQAHVLLTPDAGAMTITPDGQTIYVAEHGTGLVLAIDASTLKREADIKVGIQPNAILADHHGRVFVANSGSDTVSVIDVKQNVVTQTVRTSISPLAPLGSVPNSLSLSPDENTLYITNGGNNNVAVVSLDREVPTVKGFIPTGWYPVSTLVSPKNDWLLVGVGKGFRAFTNASTTLSGVSYQVGQIPGQAYGPHHDQSLMHDYIMSGLSGGLTRVPIPGDAQLSTYTKIVASVTAYKDSQLIGVPRPTQQSVLPGRASDHPPFDHVLYIIKENRTYDQVLGDLKRGNGDPNLVLYGRNVTPNHHAIAEQFVLLDNFFCDGEVSQDGWEWSTAANDSDWDIKATTNSYSGRGDPPGSRETIRPSNGYLWEWATNKGLTVFSYGAKTFEGLFSPTWKGRFSQEWNRIRGLDVPDHLKADLFTEDLHKAEKSGNWPNLIVMSLNNDHTTGTRPGSRTPYASVGSNDLAVGKILDAITHSKFWSRTAVFVIEDDAQNGPDHVDAHRTVALVASPYTRRGSVDHTMYTTSSMVRSIELCLGLKPESQYDAAATPMFRCFDGPLNLSPFNVRPSEVDLNARNLASAPMASVSASLDFSGDDRADWNLLNRILWADARPGTAYPGAVSSFGLSRR